MIQATLKMNENVVALLDEKLVDDEEMLIQSLLLQEVENIPTIELAQSVVERAATKLRNKRFKEQIEFFSAKLFDHMVEIKPTLCNFSDFDTGAKYFEYLQKYMFDFVSRKLCWNTDLNRSEMEEIVYLTGNKLDWFCGYKRGKFTT